MSWIVGDGFDYYGNVADLARSVWDTVPNSPSLGSVALTTKPARFSPGQYVYGSGANYTWGTKTIGSNETTLYIAVAVYMEGAPLGAYAGVYFKFLDAGAAQCTIVLEATGNIVLKRGDQNGTVVATYTAAMPQDLWQHFQFKVVIDPTAGTFTVRKNGAPTDTFTATALNTRATANSYANSFAWGNGSVSANYFRIDDLLVYSGSGAAPNTWVGDTRAICLPAVADSAVQFTATPGGTQAVASGSNVINQAFNANEINFTNTITPTRGGLLSNITLSLQSGVTGNLQAAIYLGDGGGGYPGTRMAVSTAVTNPGAGTVTFTFPAGTYLSPGNTYVWAILANVAFTAMSATATRWYKAQPYASGFPDPAGAISTDAATRFPYMVATLTGNCLMVSELLANGDTDYVLSATPTQQDLYDVADLVGVTAQAIIGVVSKIYVKKSDAGARTGQLQVVSGATTVTGVDTALSSTYSYLSRVDTTDPNTAAAWTLAGVAGIKVGAKVTS